MPERAAAWEAQRASGLEVLAVNLTDQERLKDVQAFVADLALPFPVVMADFATQRGAGPFGAITHVPTLVVLDRDGRVVSRHEGALEPDEIRAALRSASAR